ncbi:hypothetical protein DIPPA_15630 [Diplonema papillatum]|nr:hypothetical protein DIPPA_15630 [Diplonema papillatum]
MDSPLASPSEDDYETDLWLDPRDAADNGWEVSNAYHSPLQQVALLRRKLEAELKQTDSATERCLSYDCTLNETASHGTGSGVFLRQQRVLPLENVRRRRENDGEEEEEDEEEIIRDTRLAMHEPPPGCTIDAVNTAPSAKPLKRKERKRERDTGLAAVAIEQEKRIRELVTVLQHASAEIRTLRAQCAECALQEKDPVVTALKVENEELQSKVEELTAFINSSAAKRERDRLREELESLKAIRVEEGSELKDAKEAVVALEEEVKQLRINVSVKQGNRGSSESGSSCWQQQQNVCESSCGERTLLVERMKRALAPAPTVDTMSILVDSMIAELRRGWRQRASGADIKLVKKARCKYAYRDRALNLQVVDGKLAFRAGGGYKDLLTYLEREERKPQRPVRMP